MKRRDRRAPGILLASVLVAALAACAPPDPGSEDEPADGPEDSVVDEAGEEAPEEDSGDAPQGDADCLASSWLLDNESWRLMLAPLAQQSGGTLESVTGELVLDLSEDGTYSSSYTNWAVTTRVDGGSAVIERNGVDSGIWAHDSSLGTLELIEYELGSQIEGYIEDPVNGRTPLPATGADDSASLENVEYICGSEDLLITLELGTVFFTPLP